MDLLTGLLLAVAGTAGLVVLLVLFVVVVRWLAPRLLQPPDEGDGGRR